jgi:hypothetical protein
VSDDATLSGVGRDALRTPETPSEGSDASSAFEEAPNKRMLARFARVLLNIGSGLVPVAGGILSAAASEWSDREQDRVNDVLRAWLKLQQAEIREIGVTLGEVLARLDLLADQVKARVQSREYLAIVRKALRNWAAAESEVKRKLIRNLLANAASCSISSDDVVRLFVEWIGGYSEAHFKVIQTIYQNPGSTRFEIWQLIHGAQAREDSAEADLFKLLIRDLSTGEVIRQSRETDHEGNFLRRRQRGRGRTAPTLTSAFDDEKPYVLTALGHQFVHYTMNEIVPRLATATATPSPSPDRVEAST